MAFISLCHLFWLFFYSETSSPTVIFRSTNEPFSRHMESRHVGECVSQISWNGEFAIVYQRDSPSFQTNEFWVRVVTTIAAAKAIAPIAISMTLTEQQLWVPILVMKISHASFGASVDLRAGAPVYICFLRAAAA